MIDRIQGHSVEDLTSQARRLKETALEFSATARERVAETVRAITTYTREQPARALGLALGIGVLLGWLVKRR